MSEYHPFKFNIGRTQCTVIHDGAYMGKAAGFIFADVPKEELVLALQQNQIDLDKMRSAWNCLLIDTGDKKLLVDTGYGPRDGLPEGKLAVSLRELGVLPEEIDLVLLSHGHPDHIGGCTDADSRLIYPNARFMMAEVEWDFWTTESNLSELGGNFGRFARKNLPPLKDKLDFVAHEIEILPGVTIVMIPGHTPGHLGLKINDDGDSFFYLADAFLHSLQIEFPGWTAAVDLDPQQVILTRHHLLEQLAREQTPALLCHFDFPAIGKVIAERGKWHWQPLTGVA